MSNKKLLIVEDDADVRLGYHVMFKANHYDTCFAGDPASALEGARKHHPDLIILDLGLPAGDAASGAIQNSPGDNGFTVLQKLQTDPMLAAIPVIVVSARDLHGNKERALKAGAKAFVHKPWDDKKLLAIISGLLGQSDTSTTQPASSPIPATALR
jgi:CheY-like chemotaxis protein